MSRESPVAVLYDANGVALSVRNAVATPANTPGVHAMVSDGTNSRYLLADASGSLITRSKQHPTFHVTGNVIAPGLNKNMLSIRNGNAAQLVRIRRVYIVNRQTTAVTGLVGIFELKRYTTDSGTTAIVAELSDTASTLPASITIGTAGTITGESTTPLARWLWSTDEWGPGTVDAEVDAIKVQQTVSLYNPGPEETPITLRNGQGVFVKFLINSTIGSWDIRVVFTTETI